MHNIPKEIISGAHFSSLLLLQVPLGLAITLALRGPATQDVPGTVLPGGEVEFDAVISLPPGRYWWQIISESVVYKTGQLRVLPNFRKISSKFDGRTDAERMLDAVDAALAGTADEAVWTIQINGRQLQYYSVDQLKKLRGIAVAKVRSERGQNTFRTIGVRL